MTYFHIAWAREPTISHFVFDCQSIRSWPLNAQSCSSRFTAPPGLLTLCYVIASKICLFQASRASLGDSGCLASQKKERTNQANYRDTLAKKRERERAARVEPPTAQQIAELRTTSLKTQPQHSRQQKVATHKQWVVQENSAWCKKTVPSRSCSTRAMRVHTKVRRGGASAFRMGKFTEIAAVQMHPQNFEKMPLASQ